MAPIADHPLRYQLANELHARPFPQLEAPCRAVYIAIKQPVDAAAGAAGWVQITDPDETDVFAFSVVDDDEDLSYTVVIQDDGAGNTLSQRVRKIRMNLQGRLVADETIVRRVEDVISVRNDLLL